MSEDHSNSHQVKVIVSGQEVDEQISKDERVERLVVQSLNDSGNKGQDPTKWDLKTASGSVIAQEQTIEEAGIIVGATLYLNPHTGVGG